MNLGFVEVHLAEAEAPRRTCMHTCCRSSIANPVQSGSQCITVQSSSQCSQHGALHNLTLTDMTLQMTKTCSVCGVRSSFRCGESEARFAASAGHRAPAAGGACSKAAERRRGGCGHAGAVRARGAGLPVAPPRARARAHAGHGHVRDGCRGLPGAGRGACVAKEHSMTNALECNCKHAGDCMVMAHIML